MHRQSKGVKTAFFILSLLLLASGLNAGDPLLYSFKKGDTLFSIAQKYNTSVTALQTYNQIKDPARITVGTIIKIPPAAAIDKDTGRGQIVSTNNYKVKQGDSLTKIAKQFSVPLADLLMLNHLTVNSLLKTNEQLKIPVYATTAAAATKQQLSPAETNRIPAVNPTPLPVSADKSFWPHPGPIHPLSGKLSSTVEISGQPGDEVQAVAAGKVVWAGPFRGYGEMVFIQTPAEYVFVYGGNAKLYVKAGEKVTKGQVIGYLGKNPKDGEAKVFFCVTQNSKPVDPYAAPR